MERKKAKKTTSTHTQKDGIIETRAQFQPSAILSLIYSNVEHHRSVHTQIDLKRITQHPPHFHRFVLEIVAIQRQIDSSMNR